MTNQEAYRKFKSLLNMTVARGCSPAEADTAYRLAKSLAAKFNFGAPEQPPSSSAFDERFKKAEQRAATHFNWEYRQCGKRNCRCYSGHRHGPYKYAKKRVKRRVHSIYMGR